MWTLSWQVINEQKQVVEACEMELLVKIIIFGAGSNIAPFMFIHVLRITNMACGETCGT